MFESKSAQDGLFNGPASRIERRAFLALLGSVPLMQAFPARAERSSASACSAPPDPYLDLKPSSWLHVATNGNDSGDGSDRLPFATIQAALDRAGPGTAVLVHAGVYRQLAKFPSRRGGTERAPIWLISADGPGAARVITEDPNETGIKGFGVFNIVVKDFEVIGGKNGIQFSQSGSDFSATVRNIVVRGNHVSGTLEDGIKISQADNVHILENHVTKCGQQCVDFVNVWDSVIANNDLSEAGIAAATFAKEGSRNIWIVDNYIHDVTAKSVAGIAVGGWSNPGPGFARPGSLPNEADNVVVSGNRVERISGSAALSFLGASNSRAFDNYLQSDYMAVVVAAPGSPNGNMTLTHDIDVQGNVLVGHKDFMFEHLHQDPVRDRILVHDNLPSGQDASQWPRKGRLVACPLSGSSR